GAAGCDRARKRGDDAGEVVWMNRVAGGPILQFGGTLAEVFQDLPIEMLNLTCRIHGAHEPGNAVDDLAEISFDRAQVFLGPPAFGDFLSQALVGSGEFRCPSSDSLIKLGREPLLVAQEPGLSEADGRLVA